MTLEVISNQKHTKKSSLNIFDERVLIKYFKYYDIMLGASSV